MFWGCFSYCWAALRESKPSLLFTRPQQGEAGSTQQIGRGHSRAQGTFHNTGHHVPCTELEEGGRTARATALLFPRCDGALLPLGWQNNCLPMASGGWIPQFASFLGAAFALFTKLSLPQPTSPPSLLWPSPLHQDGGRERLCGTEFPAGVKPGQLQDWAVPEVCAEFECMSEIAFHAQIIQAVPGCSLSIHHGSAGSLGAEAPPVF